MKYYKAIIDANNLMESHLLTSFFGTDLYDFFEVRLENRSTARYFFNKNTSANEELLTDSLLPNCEQIGKLLSCHD